MSSSKTIIVNCGASHVTYAVFNTKGGQLIVDELYVEPLNYDYSDEDSWLTGLTAALKPILAKAKTKGDATLIAPGYQLLTKTIKVPKVEKEKQSQIIAFEAQQNIPYPLGEVVWGHQIVSDDGVEAEVILIAFKSVAAVRFCNTLTALGLRPLSVQAASVLDYNAFHSVYSGIQDTTLMINVGARSSSMLFISPGGFFARNVALGGNTLTQNIADQLGKTFLQAEQLKVSVFSGAVEYDENDTSQAVIWQAAEIFIRRMTQEISRSIVNYKRAKKGESPTMILLTGRGSLIPGFSEQLSETQQLAVDYFDPTQVMKAGAHTSQQTIVGHYAQLSEVLGQACRAKMPESVGVELIPPSVRNKIEFAHKVPFLVLSALCILCAPALTLVKNMGGDEVYEKAEKAIRQSMPQYTARHQEIEAKVAQARQISDRIAKLETLNKSRGNWLTFFADLQDRLASVKDVWLDKLEVERLPLRVAGSADTAALSAETPMSYRLKIDGRMLLRGKGDTIGLNAREASRRVERFIESLKESAFILDTEGEPEFPDIDKSDKVLRFRFTLVVNPEKPL